MNPARGQPSNHRAGALAAKERTRGNVHGAICIYDQILANSPHDSEAHFNRGSALESLGRLEDALASYNKAIELRPNFAEAYNNRSVILRLGMRYTEALEDCDKAIVLKPDSPIIHNNRGNTLKEMKLYDEALASYEKALACHPRYVLAYFNRGNVFLCKGDMKEAEKMFLKAVELRPDFSDPWLLLTRIRKYRNVNDPDIKKIRAVLDKPGVPLRDRSTLYFSLGKIYDDCGHYDEAFGCYRQANQILRSTVSYNAALVTDTTNRIMEVFDKSIFDQPNAPASEKKSPLFIVGMPRSGTTLAATILSNHPCIATAGELETINELSLQLPRLIECEAPYPEAVRHMTPDIAARLVDKYQKRLRRDTGADVPFVIDKHPLNFRHLGLIAMLFPNARIIHCTRHPLDTCLSNYFQQFSAHFAYAYALDSLGHFYREYLRIMEHWKKVLPNEIIDFAYEDMITNTEKVARRALDSMELEWDERCLFPEINPCAVETVSQWQVRQPIYRESVDRWRHYEKHLSTLKEILYIF